MLLLLAFSMVLVARGFRMRYCWVFLIMLAGMMLSLLSIFVYLTRFSDYAGTGTGFFSPDYLFFSFVRNNVKLPLSFLARMMNAGLGLYLLAVPLFVFEFTDNRRRVTVKVILFVVFIMYYLLFYDPETARRLYPVPS